MAACLQQTKVIHLLRHGQAKHNINAERMRSEGCSHEEFLEAMRIDDAFDAPLTALGVQQVRICDIIWQ